MEQKNKIYNFSSPNLTRLSVLNVKFQDISIL